MKAALSMVALIVLLVSGCTPSSVAEQANVTTAAKTTTRLYVRTDPSGAKIRLDGKEERETSPQMFDVPAGVKSMIVEVELDGHGKKRERVVIEGGRIIRVEFKFEERPQPPAESVAAPQTPRILLYLVVGKDRMTFQGKDTTWDELAKLLEKVPASKNTVLHIARAPGEMTAEHWDEATGRAIKLIKRFGFGNLSDVGVHPLGFSGPAKHHSVCLVVGKDRMTFQGEDTTWEELPKRLETIADRQRTVLNFARAPGELTTKQWHRARSRAVGLADRFGFDHLSDIGQHPLGSKWEETRTAPATKAPPPTERPTRISAESIWDGVRKPPTGWTIDGWLIVPPARTAAIEKKLGGRIKRLSNTIYSAYGQKVQVNVIEGRTEADAEKIHKAVLAMKGDPAYALRFDKTIVEFVGTFDVAFAKRAARELGLQPKPEPSTGVPARSVWDRMMNPPEDWKVEMSFIVPEDQMAAIRRKLGGRIKKVSNTIYSAHGQQVQVNVFECATGADAEKIHKAVLAMKGDPAYALRFDGTIVEFVGTFDVAFAKRAARELGLQPEPDGPKGASFGPVIERVVDDDGVGKDYLLDLDTGKLYTRPEPPPPLKELHAWARTVGIDASGVLASEGVLAGSEIGAAIVDGASWDKVTPQAVREALKQPDPRLAVRRQDAPTMIRLGGKGVSLERVYAFQTREGGVGVLQIVGPGDKDHRSVKIRYKLVSGTSASPQADHVWTCPMHPQVNVPKPGKCPTCAMDLVARPTRSAAEQAVREVISNFVEAAAGNDRASVAKFLSKRSHLVHEHTREIMSEGVNVSAISFVVVANGRALAVTDFAQVPDPESKKVMCVVYIVVKQGDRWVIEDIDLATANGLSDHIGDLQAEPDQDESTQPSKEVHLPDADTPGAEVVLDLASGEMFDVVRERDVPAQFKGLVKGGPVFRPGPGMSARCAGRAVGRQAL
ncbi:MAG: heavy metal-binding domain-containing protein [Planctomycetota bacterium]|jgi:hypothetical protein